MPRMYPASVRRQIIVRLRSGESVAAIAVDTGICQATLFRWKRQALIDSGVIDGIPSVEADEPATAHRRIAALEAVDRAATILHADHGSSPPGASVRTCAAGAYLPRSAPSAAAC
jgi:transposase-like protein